MRLARIEMPNADPAFVRVLCRLSHTFEWTDGDADDHQRRISDFLVRP